VRRYVTLAVLALCSAATTGTHASDWSYEIIPFVWAASLDGREGVNGSNADVSASFKDLLEFVNVGASMRFTARREPVDWFGEASYVELEDNIGTPAGTLRVRSAQTYGELGLSYEINSTVALYGGLRFQQLDTRLNIPGAQFSDSKSWVDGIAGVRWTPVISDHWVGWARADLGAGGSNLVWLAEAGVGYRWGRSWGAYLAYRVLDTDYEQGGFLYDVRQQGLMIGFGIRF
jgi:hypothetical protein